MSRGDWSDVNWFNFGAAMLVSSSVGVIRILQLIRRGKAVKWIDLVLEPALAIFAGLLVWGLLEVSGAPEVIRTVMVSLAAWGGPRTIRRLEVKYLGGSRIGDTAPAELNSQKGDL